MLRLQMLLMNDERITIRISVSAVRERKPAPHLHVVPPASQGWNRRLHPQRRGGGGLHRRTDLTDRQKRQFAVGVGVAMGVGLGLALNNILLGVAFGVLIGAGLAAKSK